MRGYLLAVGFWLAVPWWIVPSTWSQEEAAALPDIHAINRMLGRGINLGNALEAPAEGQWGITLEASYFQTIAQAGFHSVRLPVRWETHASQEPPYTIDPTYLARVQWAVDRAREQRLAVILNFHHHEPMYLDPAAERPRFLALWRQVASHFMDYPHHLVFEILNEPNKNLDVQAWNQTFPQALAVIRESNPHRAVMIGPAKWNHMDELETLILPEEDRRIIVTIHYYIPFRFTHQGASWVGRQSQEWVGRTWPRDSQESEAVEQNMDKVADWGRRHDRPINVGEFGAFSRADMESRARWTAAVRQAAESRGFSWHYWEFASGFGAYDRRAGQWRQPLKKALLDTKE